MPIKPNTILKCGEITFRVIEKIKSNILVDEKTRKKICKLKDFELVAYKCENVATNEIIAVPIHKSLEKELMKGQKKNGEEKTYKL